MRWCAAIGREQVRRGVISIRKIVAATALLVALIVGFGGRVIASDYVYSEEFSSIKSVGVSVLLTNPDEILPKDGMEEVIKGLVYVKFPGLFPEGTLLVKDPSAPCDATLYILVSAFKRDDGGYAGSVRLEVTRDARIEGVENGAPVSVIVYQQGFIIWGDECGSGTADQVMDIVGQLLDQLKTDIEAAQ